MPQKGNSKTAQTDKRIALTDQAKGATEGSTLATDQASVQTVSGANANVGGLTISGSQGEVHIESVDPKIAAKALESVSNLASTTLAAASTSADKTNKLLAQLAESKQTDGESGKNNIVLYVVLAALALAGIVAFGGKK